MNDTLAGWALVLGLTAMGFWLGERPGWFGRLGPTLWVLSLGLLASNGLGLRLPESVAEGVNGPLTSVAIVLLLLAVDGRRVWEEGRSLIAPFAAAVVVTCLAALLGALLLGPALGADTPPLAGLFTATYTGGSLNFVSVARALAVRPDLVTLATAADQLVFTVWFLLSLLLGHRRQNNLHLETEAGALDPGARFIPLVWRHWRQWGGQALACLALAVLTMLAATALTAWLEPLLPQVPGLGIVVLTSLALVVAQIPGLRCKALAYPLGLLAIHPFFAVIGLSAAVMALLGEGLNVLIYAALVVAVQAVGVLALARWRRWGLVDTLVSSQAAVGGPSTALALATSCGRQDLAVPGVAVGLIGYMLGTYLGLLMAALVAAPIPT
ncbi:DUF819 family protein [Synechococcus sp. CCY9201]|uniref:DUF819 family protein n=1 Tax=unclassified Synechococcus TaxID=2626047 RepID=UPI0018CD6871|nr:MULTISPECIES: DUF819 family protein [unclassified Synechococcus]MEA5475172.1 DUF819 family protein [Synechococcus sp. CCY9201]QPN60536.1 DUF819 family protein [Synechococcus sp. CBW1002]